MLVKILSWSARGPYLVLAGGASGAAFGCCPEITDVLRSFTGDEGDFELAEDHQRRIEH